MSEPIDYLRHELLQDLGESFVESYDALSAEARSSFVRALRFLRSDPLANEFTAMKLAETEAKLSKMDGLEIQINDGDVWLIFPNAAISIERICKLGLPGLVRRNLRAWRDKALVGENNE